MLWSIQISTDGLGSNNGRTAHQSIDGIDIGWPISSGRHSNGVESWPQLATDSNRIGTASRRFRNSIHINQTYESTVR